jgi:FixJ family two-component response regulator
MKEPGPGDKADATRVLGCRRAPRPQPGGEEDDGPSVLKALARIIGTAGYKVITYDRASAFLDGHLPRGPKCLVLDLQMPGLDGLGLQHELAARGIVLPVVFLTGHGDIPSSVEAMKGGALDYLTKPVRGAVLLEAVRAALDKDRARLKGQHDLDAVRRRIETLSPREYEVFRWVIAGRLNKQTASEMGISEKTVKFHRAMVMQKMKARSVAELTIIADRVGIAPMRKVGPKSG